MPHKVWIVMGQGACADLAYVSFCTGTLYTCSAIAMINNQIGRGGLYHYPAGALTDPEESQFTETENVLKQMLGYIRPTAIDIVTAADVIGAAGGVNSIFGTSQRDKNAMQNWFSQWGFVSALSGTSTWAGICAEGTCTTDRDEDWPNGNLHDWQERSAGIYPVGGTNVTLLGKKGETGTVQPTG